MQKLDLSLASSIFSIERSEFRRSKRELRKKFRNSLVVWFSVNYKNVEK